MSDFLLVEPPWFVYILYSPTLGTYYTGISNRPDERLRNHNAGRGAKYTRRGRPWGIVRLERMPSKSYALKREREIKRLTHEEKDHLIASV